MTKRSHRGRGRADLADQSMEAPMPLKRLRRSRRLMCHPEELPCHDADRLSSLSDDLLLYILSFIPVIEGVRLCVLSKRWMRLPSLLPCIDHIDLDPFASGFNVPEFYLNSELDEEYSNWIMHCDKQLMTLPNILLRSCRIDKCRRTKEGSKYVGRWIKKLRTTGVQVLSLLGYTKLFGNLFYFRLPLSIFRIKTLTNLNLSFCRISDGLNFFVGCVNLKSLKLTSIDNLGRYIDTLVSSCTVLENLHIKDCEMDVCRIYSSSIKLLQLKLSSSTRRLDINAPSLVQLVLYVRGKTQDTTVLGGKAMNTYINVAMKWRKKYYAGLASELRCLLNNNRHGLTSLQLRGASLECLSLMEKPFSPKAFMKLKTLTVSLSALCLMQIFTLIMMIKSCPLLEELRVLITGGRIDTSTEEMDLSYCSYLDQSFSFNHLRTVQIYRFTAGPYEVKLAELLLKSSPYLKNMTVRLSKMLLKGDQTVMARERILLLKGIRSKTKLAIEPENIVGAL